MFRLEQFRIQLRTQLRESLQVVRSAQGTGRWYTVYLRLSRWSKAGVIERVFVRLQVEQILTIHLEAVALDSTSIRVHPDGMGARKEKSAVHRQVARRLRHQDSSGRRVLRLLLTSGQRGDAPPD